MPALLPALVLPLAVAMGAALATEDYAIKAEILALERQIALIDLDVVAQPAPEIASAAAGRKEVLLLSKALLENQQIAAAGGATQTLVVPVQPADPERATQLFREIAATQARIAALEAEPDPAPGASPSVAVAQRLEAEKMTLARLQLSYLQAQYGLPWASGHLPDPGAAAAAAPAPAPAVEPAATVLPAAVTGAETSPAASAPGEEITGGPSAAPEAPATPPAPPWADARYPDIDYHAPWFALAHREGDTIAGWWSLQREKSALDGRAQVLAANHSQQIAGATQHGPVFSARCWNQETAALVVQDGDRDPANTPAAISVDYRLDEGPVRSARWDALGAKQGAGVFGSAAIDLLRQVYRADTLVVRLTDARGPLGESTFDLRGATQAIDAVAAACGWLPQTLTAADYREIQRLLAAAGYSPGAADGHWGPASRRAMKRYQTAAGREATGEPDRASLQALGVSGGKGDAR